MSTSIKLLLSLPSVSFESYFCYSLYLVGYFLFYLVVSFLVLLHFLHQSAPLCSQSLTSGRFGLYPAFSHVQVCQLCSQFPSLRLHTHSVTWECALNHRNLLKGGPVTIHPVETGLKQTFCRIHLGCRLY